MIIRTSDRNPISPSEITPEAVFLNRRQILKALGLGVAGGLAGNAFASQCRDVYRTNAAIVGPSWLEEKLAAVSPGPFSASEEPAPYDVVTRYNNFYEFGTGKGDPAENSTGFVTDPWSVEVRGEAEVLGKFTLEDILKPHDLEERIYRLRCVEAWSMVVPWVGFPLGELLQRFKPTSEARYVRFETLYDPRQMPGQRDRFAAVDYPYVEGLRIDEAMNELAFLAVGVYGKALPNQNGAPLRLVVPWKYGFKSIKSIVKIEFTRQRPRTTWEKSNPAEYGFYANVNPHVDHPRWSQATERRLPSALFSPNRIDTLMFNGYAPQVAHLYKGMNLDRNF